MHHSTDAERDAARQVNADRSRSVRASRLREAAWGLVVSSVATGATLAATASYEYDALGRLTRVGYSDGTRVIYRLDAAGNRTQVVSGTLPGVPCLDHRSVEQHIGLVRNQLGIGDRHGYGLQPLRVDQLEFLGAAARLHRHGAQHRALGPGQRDLLLPRSSLLRRRLQRLPDRVERRDRHHRLAVRHPGAEPVDSGACEAARSPRSRRSPI